MKEEKPEVAAETNVLDAPDIHVEKTEVIQFQIKDTLHNIGPKKRKYSGNYSNENDGGKNSTVGKSWSRNEKKQLNSFLDRPSLPMYPLYAALI